MKRAKRILGMLLYLIMSLSLMAHVSNPAQTGEPSEIGRQGDVSGTDVELLNVRSIYQFDVESPYCELLKCLSYGGFMYNDLVRYGTNNEVVPCLCEWLEIIEDGASITFRFREGARRYDGQPLTMEDTESPLNLWLDVLRSSVALWYTESVEVLDDTSIRVSTQSSYTYVLLRHMVMFSSGCVVYPKHIWGNMEDLKSFTSREAMIGCGPYAHDSYDDEAKIAYFNRYEDYHEGIPMIKRITFHLHGSLESPVMTFKDDETDCMLQYAAGLSSNYVPAIQELDYLNVGEKVSLGGPTSEFGFQGVLMSDLGIRNAVYYTLDYELPAATDGRECCVPDTKGVISPDNIGYTDDLSTNQQNTEEANRVLNEAGYVDITGDGLRGNKDGSTMHIIIGPVYGAFKGVLHQRLTQVVVQNLQDVSLDAYLDEDMPNSDVWRAR